MTKLELPDKAVVMWNNMDVNERAGVRFGMFPFAVMQAAEAEGYNGKDLCVALMDCAKLADAALRTAKIKP